MFLVNCIDNPVTSVQSRLLRAKEEMKARSKLFSQNDVTKNKTTEKPPTSACKLLLYSFSFYITSFIFNNLVLKSKTGVLVSNCLNL